MLRDGAQGGRIPYYAAAFQVVLRGHPPRTREHRRSETSTLGVICAGYRIVVDIRLVQSYHIDNLRAVFMRKPIKFAACLYRIQSFETEPSDVICLSFGKEMIT